MAASVGMQLHGIHKRPQPSSAEEGGSVSKIGNRVRVMAAAGDYFRPVGITGVVVRRDSDLRAVKFTQPVETRPVHPNRSSDWMLTLAEPEVWINDAHLEVIKKPPAWLPGSK